ncbi:MAG: UDP-N-acetylmuramate--L-alanine ligase [Bacteroidia bacterium]|nr:UDP-N-acetylmuramate--L-alanine ligase [Bacteroidia bacterium]
MNLNEVHSVFMMGIGGIGMSALARYLSLKGKTVWGYDRTETPLTRQLVAEGIGVEYEMTVEGLEKADLVIYTPAIPKGNFVLKKAEELAIPLKKRSEMLGIISRDYKTIAVGGTHGKTTTSAMLTHFLREGGVDVTGFVGGIMKNYDSNFVFGKSDWLVVEADEFDRSFLQLNPDIEVLTSVDPDHLDIYGTGDNIREGYKMFTERLKDGGALILNHKLDSFAQGLNRGALFYGLDAGLFRGEKVHSQHLRTEFEYVSENERIEGLYLNMPGRYNAENAVGAMTAARMAGATESGLKRGLSTFLGIKRRFEVHYISESLAYIDDYAHHPEEVRSLLTSVREQFSGWKVTAIFQPHLYSRTRDFFQGFAESLSIADRVILLDIYPAREEPMEGVTSEMIFDLLKVEKASVTSKAGLIEELKQYKVAGKQVILTVGAGDIDTKIDEVKALVATW